MEDMQLRQKAAKRAAQEQATGAMIASVFQRSPQRSMLAGFAQALLALTLVFLLAGYYA